MKGALNEWQRFSQEKRREGMTFAEISKLWRGRREKPQTILPQKRREFELLFKRYAREYLRSSEGKGHLAHYTTQRRTARKNFGSLLAAHRAKEDVTEPILLHLLPYTIHPNNEGRGAWQCIAPVFASDIKPKFEGAGWAKAEDWPEIAKLVFDFVKRCVEHPEQLSEACQSFYASDYSKGLQAGSLTPILNALRPDDFTLINNKSRKVIGTLTGTRFLQRITDYPNSNSAAFAIVQDLEDVLAPVAKDDRIADVFDMFCHWLVAVEGYFKRDYVDDEEEENTQYWKIAPGQGAMYWDTWVNEGCATIGWNDLGDISGLSHEEFAARLEPLLEEYPDWTKAGTMQAWIFSRIQTGDRIVANKGMSTVLGIGTVTGGYSYDSTGPHHHKLEVRWDDLNEREIPRRGWRKTLVKLGEEDFAEISEVGIDATDSKLEDDDVEPLFSLAACSEATGFSESELTRWVRAIERKMQAVLYGPPGTGKTFVAQKLAAHLIGGGSGFTELIQLHPACAYEDFIQGLRPVSGKKGSLSYDVVPGRFLEFCRRAEEQEGTCVLVLDEINRADLSRVFGELLYLLEYRDEEIPLSGGGSLQIPSNVRILGTMNTADRSIALVDHALRRRFAFLPVYPSFDVLENFHAETGFPVERLVETLRRVNSAIGDRNYEVGISFFLHEHLIDHIEDIWRMEIEPYLEEYFFDSPAKVDELRWAKVGRGITG